MKPNGTHRIPSSIVRLRIALGLPALFAGLIAIALGDRAQADGLSGEGFDGPETAWYFAGADAQYQVALHQRTSQGVHSGSGCEVVRLSASQGSYVYLSLNLTPCHPIMEFQPSVWLRANRAGIQFKARVVFPRTANPETGKPLSVLVGTAKYAQIGAWEQLRIENLPKLILSALHPLRAQFGKQVDNREAYIDRLVLNVYGGPGVTEVAIDDLELPHLVSVAHLPMRASAASAAEDFKSQRIELLGSVLAIDGRPFFPRIVEHQGESLAFLQKLGFNAVKVSAAPNAAMLDEAKQTGMWLICPPPVPREPEESDTNDDSGERLDGPYQPVLAWHLGQGMTARDLDPMCRWVERLRHLDHEHARPLVCDPADKLEQYGRLLGSNGILLLHRYVLGTTFELADFATWLRMRPRLGMPGMPVWATIETQHSRELLEQISLLSAGHAPEPAADFEQIRLMVQSALAAGVRGLVFNSRTPLDAQDPATRLRAATLKLVNIELHLADRWLAAGTPDAEISAANQAGENPGITGAVLKASHARLLLPLWAGTGPQYVPDQLAGNLITFAVPGTPEDNSVYELTVGGLRPLEKRRRVGGLHVTAKEFELTSMILLSDGVAVAALSRELPKTAMEAAQLKRDLTLHKFSYVTEVDRKLARLADRVLDAPRLFNLARSELDAMDHSMSQNDWLAACVAANRATRPLRLVERAHWEKAIASLGSPAASPLVATFGEVPYHWLLARELESLGRSRSILQQGDMESLKGVWEAGWRLYKHGQTGIKTMGEFSDDHYSGKSSLHLSVAVVDPEQPPIMLETSPLWLTSPALPAEAGQWFRIHGWVKVPKAIKASLDGLMIFDSLGREPLAERIGKAEDWKELTLYRAAPARGPWRLTIALTGVGDVWIDGMTVEALTSRPPTRTLSRVGHR